MTAPASPTRRTAGLALVCGVLAIQVAIALIALVSPRVSPYGWQMYSAVPPRPEAFAVRGAHSEPIDVNGWLVHGRIEIDRAALVRAHGCERTDADAIRLELADGTVEEIACR